MEIVEGYRYVGVIASFSVWLAFAVVLCGDSLPCAALSTELHGANSFMWVNGTVAPFMAALLPPELRDPQLDCST